ncbi:MAG: hypothetical protein ACRCZI_10425 [Cetobacterium sp.]
MASLQFTVKPTAEVSLSAATAKTVLQVKAPANQRVKIKGWGVYFDGTSVSAEPINVKLVRQSTAGTMSAVTPAKCDDSLPETVQSSASVNASVEPTTGEVLQFRNIHPQSGYEHVYGVQDEDMIKGGGYVGILCDAPANVNVIPWIKCEE